MFKADFLRPKGSALKPASLSGHDFRKRKLPTATALSCAVNKRLDLNSMKIISRNDFRDNIILFYKVKNYKSKYLSESFDCLDCCLSAAE